MSAMEQEIIQQNCEIKVQCGDNIDSECINKTEELRENEKAQKPEVTSPTSKTTKDSKIGYAKQNATKNKPNSGIPLKLKSVTTSKLLPKSSYQSKIPTAGHINVRTLEMQFLNNKKRLLQLHMELVKKQRPLLDMHKSLLRTKKELENVGKPVALEDLKIIFLKTEPSKTSNVSGESLVSETAVNLKLSVESALQSCAKACRECFVKRDYVVKVLEETSKSNTIPPEFETKIDELKKEKQEMENTIESIIKENEKKIDTLITNWSKSVKPKHLNEEVAAKVVNLEETIAQQQKAVNEAETNIQSLNKKFDEKKATYEKNIAELQEKLSKMEADWKIDKKTAYDSLMKVRIARTKINELDSKTKKAEEKLKGATNKITQLEDLLREKETHWLQEKEKLKEKEQKMHTQLVEKQSSFITRLKELKEVQKQENVEQINNKKLLEIKLQEKENKLAEVEKQTENLVENTKHLEKQVEEMTKQLQEKENEVKSLSVKYELVSAGDCQTSEQSTTKTTDLQKTVEKQTQQISKMQNSLQAHTKLAAALTIERDNATAYANKLSHIVEKDRDVIGHKDKVIYRLHEKLVLRDRSCEKLKSKLKKYENNADSSDKWNKNRCQICLTTFTANKSTGGSSYAASEVSKMHNCPQYVSESLIGMSVRTVDQLRMRLNNLRKMQSPDRTKNNNFNISDHNVFLSKQIKLGGKLYKVLQDHADQSCEDFINLLKLTASQSGKKQQHNELNPSTNADDTLCDDGLSNILKSVRFNDCSKSK